MEIEVDTCLSVLKSAIKKVRAENKLDPLDFAPEFRRMQGKSYVFWRPPGGLEFVEHNPASNLNYLLASNQFNHIVVPLFFGEDVASKNDFKFKYGLSKDSGCRISYQHFLDLIANGTLKVIIPAYPEDNDWGFKSEILKTCERAGYFPPHVNFRIGYFLHVEDSVKKIEEEIQNLPDMTTIKEISSICFGGKDGVSPIAIALGFLKNLGFEKVVNLVFRILCTKPILGRDILYAYLVFLAEPFTLGLGGYTTYSLSDVKVMSYLRLLPKYLLDTWKYILPSAPASSSIASETIQIEMPSLRGDELISLLDAHPERELKENVAGMRESMNSVDLVGALMKFRRVDEIITERYNSELQDYGRKERKAELLLNFGNMYVDGSEVVAQTAGPILAIIMENPETWKWLLALAANWFGSKQLKRRLNKMKAEDIVSWWATKWPFHDRGIAFTLWRRGLKNI